MTALTHAECPASERSDPPYSGFLSPRRPGRGPVLGRRGQAEVVEDLPDRELTAYDAAGPGNDVFGGIDFGINPPVKAGVTVWVGADRVAGSRMGDGPRGGGSLRLEPDYLRAPRVRMPPLPAPERGASTAKEG